MRNHGFIANQVLRGINTPRVPAQILQPDTNLAAAGSRQGTVVTADGVAHTKGDYVELIAATSNDAYGLWIIAEGHSTSATAGSGLLDIAVGTENNEVIIVPDLNIGYAGPDITSLGGGPKMFYIPGLFIPAGSRLSARSQAATASRTAQIIIVTDPALRWDTQQTAAVTYGADLTTSTGQSVTPSSGNFGSWTQIGSVTSKAHDIFILGIDGLGDASLAEDYLLAELSHGNSGSQVTISAFQYRSGQDESICGPFPTTAFASVDSGAKLWVRMAAGSTEARGVTVTAV